MSRTILVTGSSSGIGKAVTKHLLRQGHRVIGISRRKHEETSEHFTHYQIDLSDLKSLPQRLKELNKAHPEIDFLFLNAGYGQISNIEEMSYESIDELISFNVTHYAYMVKAFLPNLRKKDHANIVFISSVCGLKGSKRLSTYCASKFAIRGFAESIREECKSSKIHVTVLSPGLVNTEFLDVVGVRASDDPYDSIQAEDFQPILDLLLDLRKGTVIEELVLAPLRAGIPKPKPNLENASLK